MNEVYLFYVILAGLVLGLIAFFWLVVRAFRRSWLWGLGLLLFPPLGLVFILRHYALARSPAVLFLVAGVLVGGAYATNLLSTRLIDLGPREKMVDGERHITLTGWDRNDYSVLQARPDTVVLQMANADVTDQTLENLRGMKSLRELDLNDTQVSDAGLRILAELPALQIIRLRKTHVTDQGFHQYLADRETLLELDLRETGVASRSLREWKAARPDVRKYLR